MMKSLETAAKSWLTYWHDGPADASRQHQFYRCEACHGLVTWKMIKRGGCECGMSSKVRAAHLRWHEKARLLFAPWTV